MLAWMAENRVLRPSMMIAYLALRLASFCAILFMRYSLRLSKSRWSGGRDGREPRSIIGYFCAASGTPPWATSASPAAEIRCCDNCHHSTAWCKCGSSPGKAGSFNDALPKLAPANALAFVCVDMSVVGPGLGPLRYHRTLKRGFTLKIRLPPCAAVKTADTDRRRSVSLRLTEQYLLSQDQGSAFHTYRTPKGVLARRRPPAPDMGKHTKGDGQIPPRGWTDPQGGGRVPLGVNGCIPKGREPGG